MADIINITGKTIGEIDNNQNIENQSKDIINSLNIEQIEEIKQRLRGKDKDNTITLADCVQIVDDFISGKIGPKELDDFGTKLIIRAYIPLLEKMGTLMTILTKHEVSAVESTEIKMTELYKDIFFTVVLKLYGQINFNEFDEKDKKLLTYENYDKLFPIFYHYILSFCKEDYDILISMLKDCISFNGVVQIAESMENLDMEAIKESAENNKNLVESLKENKEMVENLRDVMLSKDEVTSNVVNELKKQSLMEIKASQEKQMNEMVEK